MHRFVGWRLLRLIVAAIALALPFTAKAAASDAAAITIGETHRFASRHLGDEREVNVYLPAGYVEGSQRYPVLYLIDGGLDQDFLHIAGTTQLGSIWGRSQPVIVVGVRTNDRRRELTGPTLDKALAEQYPTAGSSALFRKFIRDEVKPLIEENYRTNGTDAVLGESLAGLFIVEAYLVDPGLFDAYGAVSPSLWWDGERLSRAATSLIAAQGGPPPRLYLTIADEGAEMQAGMDRLILALARRADRTCYAPRTNSTHATIYHDVSPEVLQYLFPADVAHEAESGFIVPCSKRS